MDRAKRKGVKDKEEPEAWAFPTKARCPRCQSVNTEQKSTQPPIQYRKCRDCGYTFKVTGERI